MGVPLVPEEYTLMNRRGPLRRCRSKLLQPRRRRPSIQKAKRKNEGTATGSVKRKIRT